MEVLACGTHDHIEWMENVGHCKACYMWAMTRSLNSETHIGWGDIEWFCEQYLESLKTPEQKAAEMVAKEKATKDMTVKAHLCHMENVYVNRKGALKRVPLPCKYFCYKGVYGAPTPGGGTWADGCEAHLKGLCPAYHPDEPEWNNIVATHKNRKDPGHGTTWRETKRRT